ncbi:hypothetical protein LSAT2_016284 [Lamellibrachia satsuma]|nr:hypothetical protein LSAT2_016284 [Lamellibrachia satsuma]
MSGMRVDAAVQRYQTWQKGCRSSKISVMAEKTPPFLDIKHYRKDSAVLRYQVHQKQVIYDFVILSRDVTTVTYLPQAADVESCTKTGDTHVTLPPQPDSYSATVVMAFARQKYATTRQHFYDHDTKLASSNMLILPGHEFMRRFGHGYVSIVHDFGNDLQYVIDVDQGNCTVEPLPRSASTYPFSGPWDPAAVNTPGLFDLSAFNLTTRSAYQTSIRDVGVDVWVGTRVDWPKRGVNTTVKVFYSDIHWATSGLKLEETFLRERILHQYTYGLEPIENRRLLGLSYHTTDSETSYGQEIPDFTHVYDYRTGAPDFSVFDVSACYNTRQIKRLTFSVRGPLTCLLFYPASFEPIVCLKDPLLVFSSTLPHSNPSFV